MSAITGYVVVDKRTKALDWDGEMHPTRHVAIQSLIGPPYSFTGKQEEASEDRPYWEDYYEVCAATTVVQDETATMDAIKAQLTNLSEVYVIKAGLQSNPLIAAWLYAFAVELDVVIEGMP